jgi:CreA protein
VGVASPLRYDGRITLALGVADRTRSAQWYQEKLGFQLVYDMPALGWCELQTEMANVTFGFSDAEEVRAGGPVPTLGVRDLDAARRLLEQQGVKFDGDTVVYEGMVKLATFYDPDGHALMLFEDLSAAGGDRAE